MALGSIKASTQDASGGTPVATTTNEDGSAGALQVLGLIGNKTIYAETSRTSITGADAPTGGDLTTAHFGSAGLIELANFMAGAVRATCDTASATLTGRLIFFDGSSAPIGYSEIVTFTSDATLRLGNATGDFVSQRVLVDLGAARKAKFFVVSVSAGSWSVYVRPI